MEKDKKLQWKVNTPLLLKEMVESNNSMGIFEKPVNILGQILNEVAERAIKLNDKELNKLMIRLALYDIMNPQSPDFDLTAAMKYLES